MHVGALLAQGVGGDGEAEIRCRRGAGVLSGGDGDGVDLVFDQATFASCVLTTSVSDGGIYKRLDIISDAIGVKYAVIEDKIVITGKGCN